MASSWGGKHALKIDSPAAMAKLAIDRASIVFGKKHREIIIPNREIGRFSLFYQKSGDIPKNLLDNAGFVQHVTSPTHVSGNILDLLITYQRSSMIASSVIVRRLRDFLCTFVYKHEIWHRCRPEHTELIC